VLSENLDLTHDGTTLGTPLYMSPEQGEGRTVDARSDLYSLGATVYHLVAGRPPFAGSSALAVVMAHMREPLEPLAAVRPDLPVGLCAIVDRLLAKDPADRFPSPQDLLLAVDELDRLLVPGSRTLPAPLAWLEGAGEWAEPTRPSVAGSSPPPIGSPTHPRLRDATRHLREAAVEDRAGRDLRRRVWLATGVAAVAAFGVGLLLGRSRPRRSRLFGGRP
jgi:serine/threonine protein kinase